MINGRGGSMNNDVIEIDIDSSDSNLSGNELKERIAKSMQCRMIGRGRKRITELVKKKRNRNEKENKEKKMMKATVKLLSN